PSSGRAPGPRPVRSGPTPRAPRTPRVATRAPPFASSFSRLGDSLCAQLAAGLPAPVAWRERARGTRVQHARHAHGVSEHLARARLGKRADADHPGRLEPLDPTQQGAIAGAIEGVTLGRAGA